PAGPGPSRVVSPHLAPPARGGTRDGPSAAAGAAVRVAAQTGRARRRERDDREPHAHDLPSRAGATPHGLHPRGAAVAAVPGVTLADGRREIGRAAWRG